MPLYGIISFPIGATMVALGLFPRSIPNGLFQPYRSVYSVETRILYTVALEHLNYSGRSDGDDEDDRG
ncbi:hypothetical protein [Corynebacterium auriscanis]|uniref:hypothetical protein n=1 Tax=Corynebacterium auriscanis TaxID=99807 RepID=UPI003CFB58E5